MAARDEILKAADDPNAAPATSHTGPVPKRPPPVPPARPQPSRSGELASSTPTPLVTPATPIQMQAVPSMMVTPGTGRVAMQTPPPPTPTQTPSQSQPLIQPPLHTPQSSLVPDLSASIPVDNWMADPDTDLLRAHRMRGVRNVFVVLIGLAIVAAGVFFALKSSGGSDDNVVTAPSDAGRVYVPPAPDAATQMSRDQIIALSRKGFYSLKSTELAEIFVDDGNGFKDIGHTPVQQLPLNPGLYKIKAVVKNKPPKELKITIIGGRDTDDGTLTW